MKKLEQYLTKRVKIISISELNELDNRNYSLFENEIKSIRIIKE